MSSRTNSSFQAVIADNSTGTHELESSAFLLFVCLTFFFFLATLGGLVDVSFVTSAWPVDSDSVVSSIGSGGSMSFLGSIFSMSLVEELDAGLVTSFIPQILLYISRFIVDLFSFFSFFLFLGVGSFSFIISSFFSLITSLI